MPASGSVTVSPNATAGVISGTSPLCPGVTATYTSNGNTGGTWSSSNNAIAVVDASTGIVTAVSPGTVNIIYTVSTGCNSPVSASRSLTVAVNANAGTVTGPSPLCIGSNAFYFSSGNPGGSWSSSNTLVATVNATTGFVTVVGTGTTNIIYTVNTGCNSPVSAFKALTVNPVAPATPGTITGETTVCASLSGLIYTINPVLNATIYNWVVPAGWTITSGQGTTSITATAGNAGGNISVNAGNFCGISGNRNLAIVVNAIGTWLGISSNNWNDGLNWCGAVPVASTNVFIPAGTPNNPVISSLAMANSISVAAGATLTINNATLQAGGTITSNANIIAMDGTLEMNGSSIQYLEANTFQNNALGSLVVNNNAGVILNGKLDIYGSLTYGSNGYDLKTNNLLTLKSTLANTAWIGNMTGKTIEGDVTVERYIPNHSKAWQFLSVPVSGLQTIHEAWQDTANFANQNRYPGFGTMLTSNLPGALALGFDVYTAPGPSIKVYNSGTGGYVGVPSTKTTAISNPRGYMLFVRGDRSVTAHNQAATSTVLRTKGKLYTPADAPPVTTVLAGRFESIGNPYASAIDFSMVTKSGGVQTDFFYMWDPKLTITTGNGGHSPYGLGGFQTFSWNGSSFDVTPGGGSYSGSNRNIESGQAFFVAAPLTGGTVSFTENSKVSGSHNVNRVYSNFKQLRTNLYVTNGADQVLIDGNLLHFDASFSNELDEYDAVKLNNTGENMGINSHGKILAVERRSEILQSDTVMYNLGQLRVQQYLLEFIPANLEMQGLTAFLEDKYLQSTTPLNMADTTRLFFNIINSPGSYAADRFRIIFRKLAPVPVTITGITASRNNDKSTTINWKVENETSIQNYTIERSADGRMFEGVITTLPFSNNGGSTAYTKIDLGAYKTDNFYRVKAISNSGQVQYSNIVKVASLKNLSYVEVYPNPVTEGKMNIRFSGKINGEYRVSIFNNLGQELQQNNIYISSNNENMTIAIGSAILPGTYRVSINGPDDIRYIQHILIK